MIKIQKDYERYVILSKVSFNLSIVYVALNAFGVIKPGVVKDWKALIPWAGLMGAGFGFGKLSQLKLDEYAKSYNNKNNSAFLDGHQIQYS